MPDALSRLKSRLGSSGGRDRDDDEPQASGWRVFVLLLALVLVSVLVSAIDVVVGRSRSALSTGNVQRGNRSA